MNEFTAKLMNALVALGKEFMEHPEKYINPNSECTSEFDIWINFHRQQMIHTGYRQSELSMKCIQVRKP